MNAKDIKPIPNYIAKKIRTLDEKMDNYYNPHSTRFYAYLTKMKGELVKITVACKHYQNQWFCKQVAVHGIHSQNCLVCDMEYTLMGYSIGWYELGLSNTPKRFEDGIWYPAKDKYYNPPAPLVNKNYVLKLDAYKYSAIDKYHYADIFKYLRVYEQYPQAEYFVKIGLQHLATTKSLLQKAAQDKNFRKWLIRYAKILRNDLGNYPYFNAKDILKAYKENMPLLVEKTLERKTRLLKQDYYFDRTIKEVITETEIPKFIEYKETHDIKLSSYADYITACTYLKLDMSLPKNLYPHDFKRWHDIRIDEYHTAKAMNDAEERKELYAKFAEIAEKYMPLQRSKENTFIVVIAKSPQDLIREGRILHHCVGSMNYDQRFIKEESLIFFVRNAKEPNTPFVTMEYSLERKEILQCYGENDRRPSDNVMEFVKKKWLPYANRKLNKIAA